MKIIDLNGMNINACFVFNVGDCEVSVSTIFHRDKPEIAVFGSSGEFLKDKFESVSAAISWVSYFELTGG